MIIPLNRSEQLEVFKRATSALVSRYADQMSVGMTDQELTTALIDCLGIFGGSGGPDRLSVAHQGSGLKIWGGRSSLNHVTEQPLFSGKKTVRMAREVFKISDPDDGQIDLF